MSSRSLSAASRSPTKAGGAAARRLSTLDTAASRRPGSSSDRPDERVKVFLRIRPTKAEGETAGGLRMKQDGKGVVVYREHASIPCSEFEFDAVLGPSASQSDVYHAAVKPIVEDVLNGFNGTLMAYGQTGAGKTYSMASIAADAIGMIPRAAAEIFQHIEQDKAHEYTVYMSYVQLYMELIQDLLRPESENLQIRENEGGVFVGGVHQQEVSNITQCLHLLHLGDRNRTTAFTALNAHSSRSHAVVMLTVIKRRSVAGTADAEIQRVKVGKLFLVDLAGSERLKKSKSTGLRASEAKSINLSLTTLGMCINARADPNATHVPFRDSKLTRLLQDSLGGNAKTSLLVAACDAQEHVEETLQSMQFGQRAMCVKIQAVVNERVDYKTLQAELVATLESHDRKSSLLEATLLEKDAQLEAVQAQLQQEQAEAARMLEQLQREREALEAERQRQLAERQAALEAEQAHKQQLLRELEASSAAAQGAAAEAQAARQALAEEAASLRQQLADAAAAAAAAAQAHAAALVEQRQAAAAEAARLTAEAEAARAAAAASAGQQLADAKAEHEQQLAAVREELGGQLAAAQEELGRTQQLLKGSRAESRLLQEHHEQQLQELEAEWSGKVQEAAAAGERQVAAAQATVAARDQAIAALQQEVEQRDGAIGELQAAIEGLQGDKAELTRQVAALQGQLEAAHQQRRQLEAALRQEQGAVAELQAQVEGYERSRMNLAKSFFDNKVRSDAAKAIQRHWREFKMRRMKQQQTEGYQALHNAKEALGSLAQQHQELERRRRANLAFSGQTLVGDNLGVLQDAVESIIAAFVLPARDLKSLQSYKQKIQSGPSLARQSMAMPPGSAAASLLGPSRGGTPRLDLIRAVNPLADSVPNSARSTPREWGGSEAGAAAAPLQRQYQQQAAAAAAAQYGQQQHGQAAAQQQYGQAQLPPGPPLSRHGSFGGALGAQREGSVRGGLAGLAGKVMGAAGSPMDRLRRLSSGQYQKQLQQQQQQQGGYY